MNMKNKEQLKHMLKDMTAHDLTTIIEEDYYRAMIACNPANTNEAIDELINDLVGVQNGCAKADRFDLAIVCRGKLTDLALQIKLEGLI